MDKEQLIFIRNYVENLLDFIKHLQRRIEEQKKEIDELRTAHQGH